MNRYTGPRITAIVGPTASGKTGRAVALAHLVGGEIVSADSRQVYRGMDIGTGKDISEYGDIPCHVIDVADPGSGYNLCHFLRDSRAAIDGIVERGHVPVICGGSGLYVESLLGGIVMSAVPRNDSLRAELADTPLERLADMLATMKRLHNHTDITDRERALRAIEIARWQQENPTPDPVALPATIVGVDISRDRRRENIALRLHRRLDEGMVDEVKALLDSGVPAETLIGYGLEYRFITNYLLGVHTYGEMVSLLEIAICQFAKRQMTWFRGMERRGFTINWLSSELPVDEFAARAKQLTDQCL